MAYFWSPTTKSFLPDVFRERYEATNSWPADAVEVSDDIYEAFYGQPPSGKQRGAGSDGLPAWVDIVKSEDERLADLAAYRWERETAGVYFQASGAQSPSLFPTDRDSKMSMTGAVVTVQIGGWVDGTVWKTADGSFVPMTAQDVKNLGAKASAYVAQCFAREAALTAEIKAGGSPDITTGWPTQ